MLDLTLGKDCKLVLLVSAFYKQKCPTFTVPFSCFIKTIEIDEILQNLYSLLLEPLAFGCPGKGNPKPRNVIYYVQEYKNSKNLKYRNPSRKSQKCQYNFFSKTMYRNYS